MTIFADRVAVSSSTTGTGAMTLGSPLFSYRTWGSAYADGFVYYGIVDEVTGDWEIGEGDLTVGGTILSRDVVLSSSTGGGLVNFVAGAKVVYSTEPGVSKNMNMGFF